MYISAREDFNGKQQRFNLEYGSHTITGVEKEKDEGKSYFNLLQVSELT